MRYNSALLDTHASLPGKNPVQLPETYVIMIAETDVLKKGFPVYHVERTVMETGEIYGDRTHIILVNGAYEGMSEIGKLMADFRSGDPDTMNYTELADRMRNLKYSEEGIGVMSKALEKVLDTVYQNGYDDGLNGGQILAFSRMIRNGILTVSDAAEQMGLTAVEFSQKAASLGYQFPSV